MSEGPAATAGALAVPGFATESAGAARGDAGNQDVVAGTHLAHGGTHFLDSAHRLVAQDAARFHLRYVALEDVQVGAADGHRVNADDDVRVRFQIWVWHLVPAALAGAVVDECVHEILLDRGR